MSHKAELSRTFPLTKQKLFDYFITPTLLERWAFPQGMTLRIPLLEAKAGGRYRWEHTRHGGTYVAEGHFEELSPDRIVQIDEEIEDPIGQVLEENLLCAINLIERGESTEARVEVSGFREQKGADDCKQVWEQCFAHLGRLIAKEKAKPASA